jgi:hypothetical protein
MKRAKATMIAEAWAWHKVMLIGDEMDSNE